MARGTDAKLRRRNRRKAEADAAKDGKASDFFGTEDDGMEEEVDGSTEVMDEVPFPPGMKSSSQSPASNGNNDGNDDDGFVNLPKRKRKTKKISNDDGDDEGAYRPPAERGLKTLPLILLLLLTGTTVLPALIFAGDYVSGFLAKNNVMGQIGFRLGLSPVPRKRILSFYEKHAPEKVNEVPKILSKHYGDYPKLIKKLERKYQDYGYFIDWEKDEAVQINFNLQETLREFYGMWLPYWNQYAPQILKTAARNASFNLSTVYKKVRRFWKKHIWPTLEPYLGVPEGGEKQKKQDAASARKRKGMGTTRRKNTDYRDDVEH